MTPKRVPIYMLEDDHDDRFLTQSTLAELGYDVAVTFLSHSDELFLQLQEGTRPALIMVDYNSTPENAVAVLRRLKADEQYRDIPVVVLTETVAAKPVWECYRLGASSVIQKPSSGEGTRRKIKTFFDYWLEVAEL